MRCRTMSYLKHPIYRPPQLTRTSIRWPMLLNLAALGFLATALGELLLSGGAHSFDDTSSYCGMTVALALILWLASSLSSHPPKRRMH